MKPLQALSQVYSNSISLISRRRRRPIVGKIEPLVVMMIISATFIGGVDNDIHIVIVVVVVVLLRIGIKTSFSAGVTAVIDQPGRRQQHLLPLDHVVLVVVHPNLKDIPTNPNLVAEILDDLVFAPLHSPT